MNIGVFGIGEAGSLIASDLAAEGMTVKVYDPADVLTPAGVHRVDSPGETVKNAELVLAITAGHDAETALRQALQYIPVSTPYGDMSTNSANTKQKLASIAAARGFQFADIALMGTVPGRGLGTPMLASGSGAGRIKKMFAKLPASITVISEIAGDAATRKLLRSVVIKGLTATVIEALRGAEQAGCLEWLWSNLIREIEQADGQVLRRLVNGTEKHITRRIHEMTATGDLLNELGVEPVMTRATLQNLGRIAELGVPRVPEP